MALGKVSEQKEGKIRFIEKYHKDQEILERLHPLTRRWFEQKFGSFTPSQKASLLPIKHRRNILVSSPTGSGKTLCAFLSILDYLVELDQKEALENKVYCVYVSPLKALNKDISVNLEGPLKEMNELLKKDGKNELGIRVGLRTGDTPASERAGMLKKAPHILVTTPESLAIALNSVKFASLLQGIEFLIVDEVHALTNKRGVHLSLCLERLTGMSKIYPVRIGLSATVAPLEEVARFLSPRDECLIADVQFTKKLDLNVLVPVGDLIDTSALEMQRGLYHLLDKLIEEHKTTLIFTNTRSATERVMHHLKEMFPAKYTENLGAHHSSLSKRHRLDIEQRLREGKLKVVVTSTSLELGIDIGYIDLVILLGSPKSSARALQRIGRSGHQLHETAKGRFVVLDRDDLVECCVLMKEARERKIDKVQIPRNCLDVLAQQIYGMAIERVWDIDEMYALIKRSYCYEDLRREDFMDVISYLAGEYALEDKHIYAKIWYDQETGKIGKKGKLARVIYMTNIGTIPEESFVQVVIAGSEEKVGVIDEGFLERIKPGDVFVLGGNKYVFGYVRGMNLYVRAALGKQPNIPSWFSEMLPLSFDSALEISRFRGLMEEKLRKQEQRKLSPEEIKEWIKGYVYCDEGAASTLYQYFYEQYYFAKLPTDKRIVIEQYKGEKQYFIFHSLYGRRVNDALSRAYAFLAGRLGGRDVEIGINDYGFYLAGEHIHIDRVVKCLGLENVDEILKEALERSEILKRRFRHCATRSLMILRNYKGYTKSVGKQQMRSGFVLGAVRKISQDFPILKEARREVLEDVMDLEHTKQVLQWIADGKVVFEKISTSLPSPFSLNLILQGYSDLIKIEDKIDFLKRMHKLHMQRIRGWRSGEDAPRVER